MLTPTTLQHNDPFFVALSTIAIHLDLYMANLVNMAKNLICAVLDVWVANHVIVTANVIKRIKHN